LKLHLACHQLISWSSADVIYISTANTRSGVWMEFFFNFSSVVKAAPCLSTVDELVLIWYDLHIHCLYWQWDMDGI
jgi:hypothetical protein